MLMDDHAVIEKVLVLLEKQLQKEKKNWNNIRILIDILWDFGENCHNMKEEKVYFPLLLERGMPESGPIAVMLSEHNEERTFLTKFKNFLSKSEKTDLEIDQFMVDFRSYANLTKDHVWKENDILYPMGRKFIQKEDIAYLANEFKRLEIETLGEAGYTRFKTLVDAMEKESGERIDLLASLSTEIIGNMLDALPIEITFVDANNMVRYFNKLDKEKIFARTLSAVGRLVQQCHPTKSINLVNKIIQEMKEGKREQATFWIHFNGMYLFIAYYAVRNEKGEYQGVVEMVLDMIPFREIKGEKKLLNEQ